MPTTHPEHGVVEAHEAVVLLSEERLGMPAGVVVPQVVLRQMDLRAVGRRRQQGLRPLCPLLCDGPQACLQRPPRLQNATQLLHAQMHCLLEWHNEHIMSNTSYPCQL